uniref:Uncharacterized protein n=1 Tax=Avena sativa TaxID=4498 RepID=A0ACD6AF01_AVESA
MMFLDGCFLLHYMTLDDESGVLVNRSTLSTGPSMLRDMFLLENQLPWLVLETLMTFTNIFPVFMFIAGTASNTLNSSSISDKRLPEDEFQKHRPPHLLGLLRHYLIGSMPPADARYSKIKVHYALASSAIELAEMGVRLTASNERWFADMSIQKGLLAGELSLTSLFLNDYTACWLVNMAAFEACTSAGFVQYDGLTINSYISLLAMLVDKEEDVHVLRAKHLVHSNSFSNQEILVFFKGLARHLKLAYRYLVVVEKIEEYKRERPARIVVHRFFYNNFRAIAALLSIAGVLVGIFRALLGLKEHPRY